MQVDSTTLIDLSLFYPQEEYSIFHKLNFTHTQIGRDWLHAMFNDPFSDIEKIRETQQIIAALRRNASQWPESITNGTIMVMEKFFDSQLDTMPESPHWLNALSYRLFHATDFSLTRYSLKHFVDFLQGMEQLDHLFKKDNGEGLPTVTALLKRVNLLMDHPVIQQMLRHSRGTSFNGNQVIHYGKFIKEAYRSASNELISIFGRFDAWMSMAAAMDKFDLSFPRFFEEAQPRIAAQQLYHILLPEPIPYDVLMDKESNFIFLTGANMAGKSTFIKAVGAAVYLAHLGMGVPANKMELSVFDGLLSNINVMDNIAKGESYFFNEVQRIRNTILKINDKRKWLVLIDELFKGTNIQDAMKCSTVVIKGLIRIHNSLFILSTHLYEIGNELRNYPNISFRFFETQVDGEQLRFSYQLKEGISNDRLGYLILKREKVVELLESL